MTPISKFNFFLREFGATVRCNKPPVDGYESENLFGGTTGTFTNFQRQPKGFLAESFIKPPINIIIGLPFLIQLDRVMVNGKIGQQQSTGFELLTFSQDFSKQLDIESSVFTQVGRCHSNKNSVFCFLNKQFCKSSSFTSVKAMESAFEGYSPSDFATIELRHRQHKLGYVSHFMLRITSVLGGSACAVKSIEVWGEPSAYVDKVALSKFLQCFQLLSNDTLDQPSVETTGQQSSCMSKNTVAHSCSKGDENLLSDVPIPSEFVDPITQELLVLPLLLPSGHVVDQSTLDKHSVAEAHWGRLPSDPFTGKPFSGSSIPVVHAKLKVRIDGFLLSHPEIERHSRTVGSISENSAGQFVNSALVNSNIAGPNSRDGINMVNSGSTLALAKNSVVNRSLQEKLKKNTSLQQTGRQLDNKKHKLTDIEDIQSTACVKKVKRNMQTNCETKPSVSPNVSSKAVADKSHIKDKPVCTYSSNQHGPVHSSRLSSSLDSALTNTLACLPSFTSSKCQSDELWNAGNGTDEDVATVSSECLICSQVRKGQMYRLSCTHLICRNCLVKAESSPVQCHRHMVTTLQHDIIKVHLT